MTTINAATKAILNGTKSPVPTTADMKGALGAVYDVLSECGLTNGATAFQGLNAVRGHRRFPAANGQPATILQWGADSSPGNGVVNVNFPIQFPNACLMVVASPTSTGAGTYGVNISGLLSTLFTAVTTQNNSVVSLGFTWFAIGY